MKLKTLQPDKIVVPAEYKLGNDAILEKYFDVFNSGEGNCLSPVLVTNSYLPKEKLHPNRQYERELERAKEESEILTQVVRTCPLIDSEKGLVYVVKKLSLHYDLHDAGLSGPWGFDVDDEAHIPLTKVERLRDLEIRKAESKKYLDSAMEGYAPGIKKISELSKQGANNLLLDGNHRSVAAALTNNPIRAYELETDEDLQELREMTSRGEMPEFKREEETMDNLLSSFYAMVGDYNLSDQITTLEERVDKLTSNGDLPENMKMQFLKGEKQNE